MEELEMPPAAPPEEERESAAPRRSRGRLLARIAGILLLSLSVLLATYGVVAYTAWQRGQQLRLERSALDQQTELANQMALAGDDVAAGRFVLALRRLEWILQLDPAYPGAADLRREAQTRLSSIQESQVTVRPDQTATPRPTLAADADPAEELAHVEMLFDDEQWAEAVAALVDFQNRFPNFERRRTDTQLYNAYINLGLSLLPGDQVELGLFYLDQAERLGDLPVAATDQRLWAELYLSGIAYYGVNWDAANFFFRDLCLAAPYFHDACGKLYQGLVAQGDQFAAMGEYCPAYSLYAEARQHGTDDVLAGKLAQSREGCLNATPTPPPVTDDTAPADDPAP